MVSAAARRLWARLHEAWPTIVELDATARRPSSGAAWAIAPLAVVLVAAVLFSGVLGYLLARQSDERNEAERRIALGNAVKDYRAKTADAPLDANLIRLMEQASGLKGLRWESEPDGTGREVQSVVENGRFVGWFSWDRQTPATDAIARLWPLVGLGLLALGGFSGLAIWQVRGSRTALALSLEQVHTLATDSQTGLPNARSMLDLLERALRERKPAQAVTFLRLDLDRFEEVDATLGRVAAERLLADVTARLTSALPAASTLGAFGDGRFAVILTGETDFGLGAASDVLAAMAPPFALQGEAVPIKASIGLASAPRHGTTHDELCRRAELALEAARKGTRGAGLAVSFDPAMEVAFQERQFLKRELKRALFGNALAVHYQPIVAANGYRVVGVEALLRWDHPTRGPIAPAEFIPIAEQSGMMEELGALALERALHDAKAWPDLYVAVNLSPVQVRDRALVDHVARVIRESGVDPGRVILELTESVLIDDPDAIKTRMDALRALGVRLALDDFGSGYSSLAYLRQFPFDKLKIDKGFVAPLGRSGNAAVIIQAIVALGRALGLSVLVEGVETEEQRVLLRLAGCDEMQGFLFARPMPAAEIDRLCQEAKAVSSVPQALSA